MFFIDPDQKKASSVLLKLIVALSIVLAVLVFTGIKSWEVLIEKLINHSDIDILGAIPISLFLTFSLYAIFICINPEDFLAKYKLSFSLLVLKSLLSTVLISTYL